MKFKVGDKVRVLDQSSRYLNWVGSVEVIRRTDVNPFMVRFDNGGQSTFSYEELELAEPKQEQPTDDPIRRQLWCEVFVKSDKIHTSTPVAESKAMQADEALVEYDKRFNPKT